MPVAGQPYSELVGKRAFVTGGAQGIGRAIAAALARCGVRAAIADIDVEAGRRTACEIGGGSIAVEADVRERAAVERAFNEALAQLGGCEILIANAGVSTMQHALELTDADWDFNFAVNARGVFLTNQIAAAAFRSPGRRLHRQHGFARRQGRRAAARPLFGLEVRGARLDPGPRARTRSAWRPRQRRVPGLRQDRHAGARDRMGGSPARDFAESELSPNMSRRRPWEGSNSPRTSPTSSCSCARTRRAS